MVHVCFEPKSKNAATRLNVLYAPNEKLKIENYHLQIYARVNWIWSSNMIGKKGCAQRFSTMCNAVWLTLLLFLAATSVAAQQDDKALVMAIQLELNRLGCEPGTADGLWGGGSKGALGLYAAKVGETLEDQPTDQLLARLRAEKGRICTLPPGIVAADNRSETAHLEAVKYSYKVWSSLPAKVVSEKTEYGNLRCVAGKNGGPRSCAWR